MSASEFRVRSAEANRWWQNNTIPGILLNRLMLLFIFLPISLVFLNYYNLSFVVFTLMIPYGFFTRYLAVRAVRQFLAAHPEALEEFEKEGILDHRDS